MSESETSAQLLEQREAKLGEIEALANTAETEQRELTDDETAHRDALLDEVADLEIRAADLKAAESKANERADRLAKAAEARKALGLGNSAPNAVGGAVVTNEHRTYEKGNGVSYLQDLCVSSFGPGAMQGRYFQAVERLQRHAQENHVEATRLDERPESYRKGHETYFLRQMIEAKNPREENRGKTYSYRALSTTSGAGGEFVPPMYLTAEWIAFMRAGRVVADACHHEDLPDGTMSINIPKVSAGTSVGTQGTQNTNVSMTDLQSQFVTFPVVTKAGQQIVSLQLIERSPISFDEIVMQDLGKAYAQAVDVAVLSGAGGTDVVGILNTSGINTVTWTQASPTLKGLYGQIGVGKADIANSLFMPATHSFMTPNRWEWISQSFDSNNRPLVVPSYNGPFNVAAVSADAATAEGVVGRDLNGLATFEDANIPSNLGAGTNQDVVLVSRMEMNWLYESPIVTRALPQTYGAQLSILLQLYGYIAFTAARYANANSLVTGTGLTPPTFNS